MVVLKYKVLAPIGFKVANCPTKECYEAFIITKSKKNLYINQNQYKSPETLKFHFHSYIELQQF